MSEYAAPSGPPPPKVPEGWKAIWNHQYNEWFYVNIHTKESTWEKPTMPASRAGEDTSPGGAPPSYQAGANAPHASDDKKTHLESNNPYSYGGAGGGQGRETDEEMARRLQREEEERNRGYSHSPNPATVGATTDRGQSNSYYGGGQPQQQGYYSGQPQQQQQQQQSYYNSGQPQQQSGYLGASTGGNYQSGYPPTSPGGTQKKSGGGLFGKLKDKLGAPGGSGSSGFPPRPASYGHQSGGMFGQQAQGYPQHGGYMMPAQKKKHGMGAGGAAALGVGGGLVGGMLLADALDDDDDYGGGDDFGGGDF